MVQRYTVTAKDEYVDTYAFRDDDGAWVLYEDAAALELRIRELEQKLMTEAEKRAAFEADC